MRGRVVHNAAMAMIAVAAPAAGALAQADPPSASTRAAHAAAVAEMAGRSDEDRDFASRGYLGTLADPVIRTDAGTVVWDFRRFAFLDQSQAADTVNPSLWRHAQLLAKHGLFRVSDRIYQVRGFDLANLTVVRGDTGWIVIDTLSCTETARAAMRLVAERLGDRPISAVIRTHSHSDHFAGIGGVLTAEQGAAGTIPVIAPAGFFDEAVSENLVAGPAMNRRAGYQFGLALPIGPTGAVNSGIGPATALGTRSLPRPTREITQDGTELVVDGVRLRFQLTPGTEAPAEMNIAFPDWKVIDLAENANVTQHNILTPRGAKVRDTRLWVAGLTQAIERNPDATVMITSHGWPRFGRDRIRDFLTKQRDAYAFLHDQTVRLMNAGLTADAIAAQLKLPDALAREWYNRPYYGSISFNARAIYQFYLGWYDANPVHLAARSPIDAGRRYVSAMGGTAKVMSLAQVAYDTSDYAWAAELLNHIVMGESAPADARALLARCYDQLAWQSENSLWRNMYLSAAIDLRGPPATRAPASQSGLVNGLSLAQAVDLMAIRLDPAKARDLAITLKATDTGEAVSLQVENGVLIGSRFSTDRSYAVVAAPRSELMSMLFARSKADPAGRGDPDVIKSLRAMLDTSGSAFTPVLPLRPESK